MQQENIEKADVIRADADGKERIDVDAAHLDIFDAALAESAQRPLAGTYPPLRPDLAVELVFDLQQGRRQLAVIRAVADADRFVSGIRLGQRTIERDGVALETVEAH